VQEAEAHGVTKRDDHQALAAERGFNRSSFQKIAQLLPPERVSLHLRTLARLIDEAVSSEGDQDLTRNAVHKLISVSATLGFDELSCSCLGVEQAYCEGRSSSGAHSRLRRAAEVARPLIERLAATND
jgi:hypothetical protein